MGVCNVTTGIQSGINSTCIPVLIIFAPTGTGKTDLVDKLFASESVFPTAGRAEIISADSMQVYKGLDIGTAKPDSKLLSRLPHRLINIVNPFEQFGAGDFVPLSDIASHDIFSQKKMPAIVGGTAFYIKNFLYGLPPTPRADEKIRNDIEKRMEKEGAEALMKELVILDPKAAAKIHINDKYRIKRALEVCKISGKPRSFFEVPEKLRSEYVFNVISLDRPRDVLYNRINQRVEKMFAEGLYDEVKTLIQKGYCASDPGMQAIGYREFFLFDKNDPEYVDKVKEAIKKDTRRYAKRQETFFNSIKIAKHFSADDFTGISKNILDFFNRYIN